MACVRDCLLCSSTCREEGDETLYASNNDVADFIAKIAYRGRQALALLVESSDYALRFNRNVAEFSVEVGELKKAGLTTNGLRGMLCAALIEQIPPPNVQSGSNGNGRWRPPATISDTASFVLTPAGLALLRHTLNEIPILAEPLPLLAVPADGHEASTNGHAISMNGHAAPAIVPSWNADLLELHIGPTLIKQFKVPALNQVRILNAFEEEHWPPRVDDPLSVTPGIDPKRRLHNTINALNRKQSHPIIRFMGDGTGLGIRWKFRENINPD